MQKTFHIDKNHMYEASFWSVDFGAAAQLWTLVMVSTLLLSLFFTLLIVPSHVNAFTVGILFLRWAENTRRECQIAVSPPAV